MRVSVCEHSKRSARKTHSRAAAISSDRRVCKELPWERPCRWNSRAKRERMMLPNPHARRFLYTLHILQDSFYTSLPHHPRISIPAVSPKSLPPSLRSPRYIARILPSAMTTLSCCPKSALPIPQADAKDSTRTMAQAQHPQIRSGVA